MVSLSLCLFLALALGFTVSVTLTLMLLVSNRGTMGKLFKRQVHLTLTQAQPLSSSLSLCLSLFDSLFLCPSLSVNVELIPRGRTRAYNGHLTPLPYCRCAS